MTGRWTSRKFLLALGGFATMVANKQYPEALTILLSYLGVEGAVDLRASVNAGRATPGVSPDAGADGPDPAP